MGKTHRKTQQGTKMPDGARQSGTSSRNQRRSGPLLREVQVSKKLSWLLRHGAEKEGLKLGPGGYVNVADLLNNRMIKSSHVTFEEIKRAVENNEKQRFGLVYSVPPPQGARLESASSEGEVGEAVVTRVPEFQGSDEEQEVANALAGQSLDETVNAKTTGISEKSSSTSDALAKVDSNPYHYLIRANQGHSIKLADANLLTPITLEAGNLPDTVVHGTRHEVWPMILSTGGLKPMRRNHVHFATGVPEQLQHKNEVVPSAGGFRSLSEKDPSTPEVISGMRSTTTILIFLDLKKALERGLKFWMSENGVVLTEGGEDGVVPVACFERVEDKTGNALVENGEFVAEVKGLARGSSRKGKSKNTRPKLNTANKKTSDSNDDE